MKKLMNLLIYIIAFPIIPISALILLFPLKIDWEWIIVIELVLTAGCLAFNEAWFIYHTKKLHNMDNDYFKLDINDLKKNKGIIVAKLKTEKWVVEIQGQKLEFALQNYPFQKSYICAYFIRQLLYYEMNESQRALKYLFKIFQKPIHKLQKKELPQVAIEFHENDIVKKVYIAKNFKPLNTVLRRWITQAPYAWAMGGNSGFGGSIFIDNIKKINEQKYWDKSSIKIKKMRSETEQEKTK